MSIDNLPAAGAASAELRRRVHEWWVAAAQRAGLPTDRFRADAHVAERITLAAELGLVIAAVLSRFSSKLQHSTDDQVRECVEWAARNGLYVPPELVCVDEAVSGRKTDR